MLVIKMRHYQATVNELSNIMFWLSEISILVEQQLRVCTALNVGHTRRGSHAILEPMHAPAAQSSDVSCDVTYRWLLLMEIQWVLM